MSKNALVVDEAPSYLKKLEADALNQADNFDESDVVVPRIKLLQGTSEENETFDSAKPGIFWHTGYDAALGKEMNFVVASRKKKWLLQAPLADGQGILARADDGRTWDRTGEWDVVFQDGTKATWTIEDVNVERSGATSWGSSRPGDDNSPPAATLFYEYLVLLPDHLDYGPAILSLARSQIKRAKKGLNDKIALHKGAGKPMQSLVFMAKATAEPSPNGGTYYNMSFQQNGFANSDLYEQAVDMAKAMESYKVEDEDKVLHDEDRTSDEAPF